MIKFKRLTIALAALFIASATAWADGTLLTTITASADFQSGSKTFDNIATVTLDGDFYGTTDWAGNGTITVTPAAGVTITSVKFINSNGNIEDTTAPFQAVQAYDSNLSRIRYDVDGVKGDYPVEKIEVYGTAGTPLDLTEVTAGKQWKIETMPAGNVTLNVEYEPEFTAIFKALNANTIQGGKATVTVTEKDGTTAYTGATLDADGNYKPLYEGQTITLTAQTGYKFRSVTATKGAAAAGITNPEVGQIIGSDGKNYAADATLPTGVTAVAMIAYVGATGDATYNNGLALALADENSDKMTLENSITAAANHSPAVTFGKWFLASEAQWGLMINARGSDTLRDGFNGAGGTNLQNNYYWSSTKSGNKYRRYDFYEKEWYDGIPEQTHGYARACLAF